MQDQSSTSSDVLGSAVLRIISDKAANHDFKHLVRAIVHDSEFRERCMMLSALTSHYDKSVREQLAKSTVQIMQALTTPEAAKEEPLTQTCPAYMACKPSRHGKWKDHVRAHASYAHVTPYLAERIRAVETLWAVPGFLVRS